MSADTIPAELADILRGEIGAAMDVTEDGTAMSDPNFEAAVEDVVQAVIRVLGDRSTRPAEPAAPTVDTIAAFLHNEIEWPEDNYPAYAWPEVDGDTGQRDGGYVKIVPKYVVEEFRGIARRLLIAFRQEGVVPAEPAAPVAEAGDDRVCMCGALEKDHSAYDGHSFVDMEKHQTAQDQAERWGYSQGHTKGFEEGGRIERKRADFLEAELEKANATLEAERARVAAAEQRAADALARAEKAAEDERDRLFAKIMEEGPFMRPEHDQGIRQFLQSERATMPADRAAARASREAQPATDGGGNG